MSHFIYNTFITDPVNVGKALNLEKEAVFVIGDVHGHNTALISLLRAMGTIETAPDVDRHLVFLGDLIDRGPDSLGSLKTALGDEGGVLARADKITRLKGNHELLFLDTLEESKTCGFSEVESKSANSWLNNGGFGFCRQVAQNMNIDVTLDQYFFEKLQAFILNESLASFMKDTWESHLIIGNLLLVHAGVFPKDIGFTLNLTDDQHSQERDHHWAWIRDGFLDWAGPFSFIEDSKKDFIVVHGHTSAKGCEIVPDHDQDLISISQHNNRINLDFGSASHIAVGGAVFFENKVQFLRNSCVVS
jgi:serine/threonine protein phosphatase 1